MSSNVCQLSRTSVEYESSVVFSYKPSVETVDEKCLWPDYSNWVGDLTEHSNISDVIILLNSSSNQSKKVKKYRE